MIYCPWTDSLSTNQPQIKVPRIKFPFELNYYHCSALILRQSFRMISVLQESLPLINLKCTSIQWTKYFWNLKWIINKSLPHWQGYKFTEFVCLSFIFKVNILCRKFFRKKFIKKIKKVSVEVLGPVAQSNCKALQKLLTFFQQKILADISIWYFNKTITNDIVSFEQPGPGINFYITITNTVNSWYLKHWYIKVIFLYQRL